VVSPGKGAKNGAGRLSDASHGFAVIRITALE
jgi:hypothetical protein